MWGPLLILSSCFRLALTEIILLWLYPVVPELNSQKRLRAAFSQVLNLLGAGMPNSILLLCAGGGSLLREMGAAAEPTWKAPDSGTPFYPL